MNLSWDKPIDDGGSRIQGYLIDKREIDSDTWQRVNAAICVATQINISNLIEGRQYVFRVFAQNEAGLSLPSQASNTVTIKDPLSNFEIFFIQNSDNIINICQQLLSLLKLSNLLVKSEPFKIKMLNSNVLLLAFLSL